jgi:hypothetical protein
MRFPEMQLLECRIECMGRMGCNSRNDPLDTSFPFRQTLGIQLVIQFPVLGELAELLSQIVSAPDGFVSPRDVERLDLVELMVEEIEEVLFVIFEFFVQILKATSDARRESW